MKTFRLAFLLGILSTNLVGCGGGTPKVKVTFNGTNCFIRNGLDDKAPEFTTLEVEKDSSQTFQIFVKDTEKYLVPDGSGVDTGDVNHTYYQTTDSAGHKEGQLVFPKIDRDVTITATAREKAEITYSVTYMHDSDCKWADDNPTSIKPNETLVAKITSDEPTTKDGFYVYVKGTGEIAKSKYTYENKTLTLDGSCVTNDVIIYAFIPQPTEYTVDFTMANAMADFPAKQTQGIPLIGYIYANEGYRVPTKDELAPEDVGQHPYPGTIKKYKPGVEHPLRPSQFYYESYIDSQTGISTGFLIIYDVDELWDAERIEIGGTPIKQVTVTFQVNEEAGGHWQNPSKTTEDRDGIIDIGDTLSNALMAASGGEHPTVDTAGMQFADWQNESGDVVNPQDEINQTVKVHATYKRIDCNIINEISSNITISPELPKSVYYNDPLTEVTLTAKTGYKLPEKEEVSVTMRHIDEKGDYWEPIGFNNFKYERGSDNTTAAFSIGANIITGDIKIAVTPILYYSITFDPDSGIWPTGGTAIKTTTVPADFTYAEAFDTLKTRGYPTRSGQKLSAWKFNDTAINMEEKIKADGMTLKAEYSEITTFQNDSWENVIKHAEAGDLQETYLDTIFLGAERSLNYTDPITNEQKIYQVRVIDSGYDRYYTRDGKMVKSGLTFEFVDLIGDGKYGENVPDTTNGRNSWWDSIYRSNLSKFYEAICKQNAGFAAKPAIKYTLHGYVTPEEATTMDPRERFETTEYFFPLSGAEIGLADSNGATNATKYPEQQRRNEAVVEGITVWPYEYYRGDTHSRLKKIYGSDSATEYWLRSPKVYIEPEDPESNDDISVTNCYFIKNSGGKSTDYAGRGYTADYEKGYMAAFCI